MKLVDSILLSLAVAFFIIGVHQGFTVGLAPSYWLFMLSTGLWLAFAVRRRSSSDKPTVLPTKKQSAKTSKSGPAQRKPGRS